MRFHGETGTFARHFSGMICPYEFGGAADEVTISHRFYCHGVVLAASTKYDDDDPVGLTASLCTFASWVAIFAVDVTMLVIFLSLLNNNRVVEK